MEDKKDEAAEQQPQPTAQTAPSDALEKTNEELNADAVNSTGSIDGEATPESSAPKKPKGFKAMLRRFNVYLLGFLLIVAIVVITGVVSFLNSKKVPKTPDIASQQLTTDTLKQLANSDTTVGNSAQTLTVQGNAIFSGQVLVQKDLDVAGRIRSGGDFQAQTLTIAGKSNLADTQVNSLQVATTTIIQGLTTMKDINVSGAANFSGPLEASQITVTKLIMSGNAQLQIPNHLAFTGAPAIRASIDNTTLGGGGTATVNGTDTAGTVNVSTGSTPSPGCFIKINFGQAYTGTPRIIISPFGIGGGQTQYYVTKTNTSFSICTANAAPANQVFGYDYFVAGS